MRNWRASSHEFAQAVHAAIDECAERDGQAARALVSEHIEAVRQGKRIARQVLNPRNGEVVELLEPVKPETALIQAALRRWDTRYRASLPAPAVEASALPFDGPAVMRRIGLRLQAEQKHGYVPEDLLPTPEQAEEERRFDASLRAELEERQEHFAELLEPPPPPPESA